MCVCTEYTAECVWTYIKMLHLLPQTFWDVFPLFSQVTFCSLTAVLHQQYANCLSWFEHYAKYCQIINTGSNIHYTLLAIIVLTQSLILIYSFPIEWIVVKSSEQSDPHVPEYALVPVSGVQL